MTSNDAHERESRYLRAEVSALGWTTLQRAIFLIIAAASVYGILRLSTPYRYLLVVPSIAALWLSYAWSADVRLIKHAVVRALLRILHGGTAMTTGSWTAGWHEGDEWNFTYTFVAADGRQYTGQAGTEYDMIHAAHALPAAELTALLDRFTSPNAIHICYLRRWPHLHSREVHGEVLW